MAFIVKTQRYLIIHRLLHGPRGENILLARGESKKDKSIKKEKRRKENEMKFNSQEKLRLAGQFKRGKEARKRKRVTLTERKGKRRREKTKHIMAKNLLQSEGGCKNPVSPLFFFYL
jgi:hypothetical protein